MDHTFNNIIDSVVCEVKSQGIFDEFRRECMADVDTKPAYQNLRQRVENSVSNFLNQQEWKPDLNKNQLREKLRKNIAESAFLDTGVERIVDQVVNPKINSIFLPKIEEIYYKFMGIEKPKPNEQQTTIVNPVVEHTNKMDIDENDNKNSNNNNNDDDDDGGHSDLEAVSPDSNKSNPKCVSDIHTDRNNDSSINVHGNFKVQKNHYIKIGSNNNYENVDDDDNDEDDDFESPAFEPLDHDIGKEPPKKIQNENSNDSKLSGISGLTSQDSLESENAVFERGNTEQIKNELNINENEDSVSKNLQESKEKTPPLQDTQQQQQQETPPQESQQQVVQQKAQRPPQEQRNEPEDEQSMISLDVSTEINDVIDGGDGEHSQLSQVSSSSRLSIITDTQQSCDDKSTVDVNICEEAQMPKFDDKDNDELNKNRTEPLVTTFTDITKTEIKFEGTERCKIIDNTNAFDSYDDSSSYDVKPVNTDSYKNLDNYNQSSMISSDKSSDEHSKLFIDDSSMVNDESDSLTTNEVSQNKTETFSIKKESQSPTDNNMMKPIIKDTENLNLSDVKKINQIELMEIDDNNKKIQENIKQETYDMISQDNSILMGDDHHEQFDNGKLMDESNDKVIDHKKNLDENESQKQQSKSQNPEKDNDHSLSSKSVSSSKSNSDTLKKDRHYPSSHRSRSAKSHSDSKKSSTSHREHSSKTQDTEQKNRSENHSSKSSHSRSDDKSRSYHRSSTSSKNHSASTSSSKSSRSSSSSNHHQRHRSHHSERSNSKHDDISDGVENKSTVHDSKYNKDKSGNRHKNEGSSNSKRRHRDESNSNSSNHGGKDKSSDSNGQKPKEKDEDDHYSSREKTIERRRSNDRDSNDERDNGLPLSQSHGNNTNDKLASSSVTINESSSQINTTKSSSSTSSTSLSSLSAFCVFENKNNEKCNDGPQIESIPMEKSASKPSNENKNVIESEVTENVREMTLRSTAERLNEQSLDDNEFVFLPTLPVVIDQILTGNDKNVELLIDQNRNRSDLIDHHNNLQRSADQKDELFYSTINTTLNDCVNGGIRGKHRIKPKFAENFHEAKKLMKIRKQIDREEQKRREKALVFAKQYINKNMASSTSLMANMNEQQGIEFEFACQTTTTSPTIASSHNSGQIVENVISIISNAPTQIQTKVESNDRVESENSLQPHQVFPNESENEKQNVEHVNIKESIQNDESKGDEKSVQLKESMENENVVKDEEKSVQNNEPRKDETSPPQEDAEEELVKNNTSDSVQTTEFVQNLESIVNETAESKETLFGNLETARTAHELQIMDHMQNAEDLLHILETSENTNCLPFANQLQKTESLPMEENLENKSEALQISKPWENTESLQNDNGILLEIAATMNDESMSNMNKPLLGTEPMEISDTVIQKEVEEEILENPLPTNDDRVKENTIEEKVILEGATEIRKETLESEIKDHRTIQASGTEQKETLKCGTEHHETLESALKQQEIQDSGTEHQETLESVLKQQEIHHSGTEQQETLDSVIELKEMSGCITEQQKILESGTETQSESQETDKEEQLQLNASDSSEILDDLGEIMISPLKKQLPNENGDDENLNDEELPFYGFPCNNFIFPYDEKAIAESIKAYANSLKLNNVKATKKNLVMPEVTLNKKTRKLNKSIAKSIGKPIEKSTEKSIAKPIEKPIGKSPQKSIDKLIDQSNDKPNEETIDKPADIPVEKPKVESKRVNKNSKESNLNKLNGFYKGTLQVNVYDIKYHDINMKRKLNDAGDNLNNVKVFKIDTTLNNNINSLDEQTRTISSKSTKHFGAYSSSVTSTSSSSSSSSSSHSPPLFNEFPYKENHFNCDSKRRCSTRTEQMLNASPNCINEELLSKNATPKSTPNRNKTPSISMSQRISQRYSTADLYKPKRVTTSSRRRLINND